MEKTLRSSKQRIGIRKWSMRCSSMLRMKCCCRHCEKISEDLAGGDVLKPPAKSKYA